MKLYTIGFTKKSAEEFFGTLKVAEIGTLIDIRLNNKSQLAGFSKGEDLRYFLRKLCGCRYEYCPEYAPTKEILDAWHKKVITWNEYETRYIALMNERGAVKNFWLRFGKRKRVCLLCSEKMPQYCHRRLLSEMISEHHKGVEIIHVEVCVNTD